MSLGWICDMVVSWEGWRLLSLNFSLFHLHFLEQVQDSIWKDEGQVHSGSRHANPHQSQEGLLERQWRMHLCLLPSAVRGQPRWWYLRSMRYYSHICNSKSCLTTWIRKKTKNTKAKQTGTNNTHVAKSLRIMLRDAENILLFLLLFWAKIWPFWFFGSIS